MRRRWLVPALLTLLLAACGGSAQVADEAETAAEPPATSSAGDDASMDDGDTTMEGEMDHDETPMAEGETGHDNGAMDHSATASDEPADLTVNVVMTEFAYELDLTEVPMGVPVRFAFDNRGAIPHEAIIGDVHIQDEHEAAMAAGDGHDDAHGDDHHGMIPSITLEAGETGDLVVTFDEAGETLIGCHIAGHYDAGMVTTLTVVAS